MASPKSNLKNLFSLNGKNAIVTGGVGLLGKNFCAGLAAFGANIAVVDLDSKKVTLYAKELEKRYGVKAIGIVCDVSDAGAVDRMVAKVTERFGKIHILHNNAASKCLDLDAFFAPVEKYSPTEWRKIMAVNIDGMFFAAQAVGKVMASQKEGGTIIQTASIYGIMGPDHRIYEGSKCQGRSINSPAVYAASKGAVVALTKYLATYWADKGIRVNTLTPGGVESGQDPEFKSRYTARIPLGRMARPDEMIGALIFLASEASTYVTGHNLVVDGGLNAW
jgi:NAD(P)-dependent dehydrogenase (short-subunit alcohol dehydrogenase family)